MTARLASRWLPLTAMAGLIVVGIVTSTWGVAVFGRADWALPDDLWRTLIAAQRLLHGDLSGLYTPPTELVSFPGAAVILVPAVAVIDAAGLSLQLPGPQNPDPSAWLLAGPYEIAVASLALFAADAIAAHLGAAWPKRAVLAVAGAVALWGVTVRFGHPEDAVALGLFLYGVLALAQQRASRSGWLTGAAVAVQPLVLLALPVLLAVIEPRRRPGFLARAAAPGAVLLGIAAAANGRATVTAVTSQPNSPAVNHPTPWTSLAGHLAAPGRAPGRRHGGGRAGPRAGHPGGVRMRRRRRAARADGGADGRLEPGNARRAAVVDRGGAGPALGVRAGHGGLLPVARVRGGPDPGGTELAASRRDVRRRHRPHDRGAGSVAGPVELVGADDHRPGPRPVARPCPPGPRR